jgi:glycerol transport system ATP-binding protein
MIYVTHDQVEAMTFADKIVVMYEGEIVQMGTPEELFENPEHTFVGYFIGSPGMNFLKCKLDGHTALVGNSSIPLLPAHNRSFATDNLKIGIRPMYVEIHKNPVEHGLEGAVVDVEDQGFCKIVTAVFDGNEIKARVKDNMAAPEGKCWITLPPEKIKLYCDERLVRQGDSQ